MANISVNVTHNGAACAAQVRFIHKDSSLSIINTDAGGTANITLSNGAYQVIATTTPC